MSDNARAVRPHAVSTVPRLPAVVRYYDDFTDSYCEILNADESDEWVLSFNGRTVARDFREFDAAIRQHIKSWCAVNIAELSPVTALHYSDRLAFVETHRIVAFVECRPMNAASEWRNCLAAGVPYSQLVSLKSLLQFLCRFGVGAWTPDWRDLVTQLPLPRKDKYASVRTGDVFLSIAEEANVVRYLDEYSETVAANPARVSDEELERSAALVCSYEFALRPKQIAMLEMRNIRIWNDGLDPRPAVHLSFTMIKQRSARRVFPMVRRVKREWSAVFIELYNRCRLRNLSGSDHAFRRTPTELGQLIAELAQKILGGRRTGMEFRHSAAQRLVDAGASEEELAAFMGHTDLNTGLMYFRSSRSQAQRVNEALGLSEVYRNVTRIAQSRFITPDELLNLKGDQQVAGVPHGMPISGIGGCSLGQPSCPYNPVTSCYGCPKFMPVTDVSVHQGVLDDLRAVMKFFYASSRGERGSPALQLEKTIAQVQSVVAELEDPDELSC